MKDHTILILDDEPNILKSLERLLEDEDNINVLTSTDGNDAIEILKQNEVSLIITDYRMPYMSGVEFLEKANEFSKNSVKIMLSGFADIEAVINAVNQGRIFRFITKPWNDEELLSVIYACLKQYSMEKDNIYLNELAQKQNMELTELNEKLNVKIKERTFELQEKAEKLETVYKTLNQSFLETIKLILKVIQTKDKNLSEHSLKVADFAVRFSKYLNLNPAEIKEIQIASLLHDIGKIDMPEDLLFQDENILNEEQKHILRSHPVNAKDILLPVKRLSKAAEIIMHHHENYDGTGYPSGIKGESIPLESKIIALANFFVNSTYPMNPKVPPFSKDAVVKIIEEKAGTCFDPELVISFKKFIYGT